MKVAYLPFDNGTEDQILLAFVRKNGEEITIGDTDLTLPTIVNVSGYKMPRLSTVLLRSYREFFELAGLEGKASEAAKSRFVFRVNRVVESCIGNGTDILVVFDKNENQQLLRDTLKKSVTKPRKA